MDPLDEQLAKLKLLNSAPLSPRIYSTSASQQRVSPSKDKITVSASSGSAVAALASNFESPRIIIPANSDIESSSKLSPAGVSPKKVGPIVPPKPNKKQQTNFPEVPQSILVKQTCEPLYSKRLQSNGGSGLSKTAALRAQPQQQQQQRVPIISPSSKLTTSSSRAPILHRKQPIYATQNNIYSNNSTVTLDNPAILDQQLEALAHHKKQLEKKGLLMQQQQTHQQHYHDVPKLSSASFLSDLNRSAKGANSLSHKNVLYTNIRQGNEISGEISGESLNVYGNIGGPQHQQHLADNTLQSEGLGAAFVYSNLQYGGGNGLDDLPPPPPAVLSIATADPSEYLSHGNPNDDEIPPPPSPVSSSYSELRRATDIFPKLSLPVQTLNNMQQHSQTASITSNGSGGKLHHQHGLQHSLALESGNPVSVCSNGTVSGAGLQQTYMNMGYHHNNDYSTYVGSPSSQSFSQISSDYYGYGSFSQGSSTYESIYEPINPRPPSQLSSRSNYMMYAPYVNGPQASDCSSTGMMGVDNCMSGSTMTLSSVGGIGSIPRRHQQQSTNGKLHNHKEAEVEALTDLLVHSMDSGNDSDSFGVCVTCNERVVGENSGCTAMDQVFHIACFTCCQCQINLQGKPFYALEGKPYCEYDYLQTLEKCSVCMKPILERILRATGKPYHPQCFTCVVCGNSLDGIPFTVDATNQNYCIADFHKKFAPRCCVCKLPIMPEAGQEETVRVVALDRSFHFECYKCEDCGLLLSSEAEGRGCYPLDDHVLCKSCNAKRVQTLTNRMTTEL